MKNIENQFNKMKNEIGNEGEKKCQPITGQPTKPTTMLTTSHGYEDKADYDNQNSDDYNDEWDDDDYFAQPDEDDGIHEENYEYEDMPGDNADEREEYYDNIIGMSRLDYQI